jgi:ferredoxin-NADP reductase
VRSEPEFDVVVTGRRVLAEGVIELTMCPQDREVPTWEPGAHLDVHLAPGMVRRYSLCGDPGDRGALAMAVLREPQGRGGSALVHDRVRPGDRLRVRGPRNHFRLLDAGRYLFIGGGIGITPLLPMVRAVARAGTPWRLIYGGRTLGSMAYLDDLTALARASASGELKVCPRDTTGLLDLDGELARPAPGTLVYCCGPEPLLQAVGQRCAATWPPGSLHVERFAARQDSAAGWGDAFEVECSASGVVVRVPPGISVLEAVQAAGVSVLSSCQEGTCGTCETVVLDGIPDHRDSVLGPAEQAAGEVMMICCSRARSPRLVLEL